MHPETHVTYLGGKWDENSIKMLMKVFQDVDSSKIVKNKWQRVAKEVNKEGYQFSGEQCRHKI